jgi:hypothetical protein
MHSLAACTVDSDQYCSRIDAGADILGLESTRFCGVYTVGYWVSTLESIAPSPRFCRSKCSRWIVWWPKKHEYSHSAVTASMHLKTEKNATCDISACRAPGDDDMAVVDLGHIGSAVDTLEERKDVDRLTTRASRDTSMAIWRAMYRTKTPTYKM